MRTERSIRAAACTFFVVGTLIGLVAPAAAQEWPAKNITVIVPLGAGSATDVMTRVIMDQVGKQLGRTIIVENRPGAGGTIGANVVAKSSPDGYTALAYGALSIANALYSKIPYDTLHDFVPVIGLGQQPLAVVTSATSGYKTLGDLIAAAKARPGALNYTSAGIGSASHFGAERLLASAGISVQHIAFKGAAEAITDVVAGRADFSIQPFIVTLSLVNDGKLVPLAVSAAKRTALAPNVPTTMEAGLPADSFYPFWSGLFLPGRHAARHRREVPYRDRGGAAGAERARATRQARRRAARHEPRAVRQILPRRRRGEPRAGQGRAHPAAVIR